MDIKQVIEILQAKMPVEFQRVVQRDQRTIDFIKDEPHARGTINIAGAEIPFSVRIYQMELDANGRKILYGAMLEFGKTPTASPLYGLQRSMQLTLLQPDVPNGMLWQFNGEHVRGNYKGDVVRRGTSSSKGTFAMTDPVRAFYRTQEESSGRR